MEEYVQNHKLVIGEVINRGTNLISTILAIQATSFTQNFKQRLVISPTLL